MDKHCPGCGAILQSDDPAQPGYLPGHVLASSEDSICQRCYRIVHYGREERVQMDPTSFTSMIREAAREANCLLYVVDIIDFEGSTPPELFLKPNSDTRIGIVLNKTDLLPPQVPRHEAEAWAREELQARRIPFDFVQGVSAETGRGVDSVRECLSALKVRGKVAILGVTNVGKSTFIRRLAHLAKRGPTTSRFRGTTLGRIDISLPGLPINLLDTPGLVPVGRMTELLCPDCRQLLVPSRKLQGKLYRLLPGRSILFGRLGSFTNTGLSESLVSVYSPADFFHETSEAKKEALLSAPPSWLQPSCSHCGPNLDLDRHEVTVPSGYDLAVSGLGWLSVRNGDLKCEALLPAAVRWRLRPNLVGAKKQNK